MTRVPGAPVFDPDDFPGGLGGCLEAVLMVSDRPQSVEDLSRVLGVGTQDVSRELGRLRDEYDRAGRGFALHRGVRGWRFVSRADYEPVVRAFVADGQHARLSQAALEALAIIAYKQPVTRSQVASIRGVNSDGVIRSLTVRGLVVEHGVDKDTHAALLNTSDLFLEKMGLDSLEQLPGLAPFLPESTDGLRDEYGGGVDAGADLGGRE